MNDAGTVSFLRINSTILLRDVVMTCDAVTVVVMH